MEEALEILWTYARREPLDSNGETIVPTISNSIAAIRIIMRLEGWAMGSEKRKVNSEKRATHNKPASHHRGKVRESGVCEQFAQPKNAQSQFAQSQFTQPQYAQPQYAQPNRDNNTNNHNEDELPNMGELLTYSALADFAPTPAQHQYPLPNTATTAGASLQLVPI